MLLDPPTARPVSPTPHAPPCCVLVHGFNGSPVEMEELAAALVDAGFTVRLARLPGHEATHRELAACGWRDWLRAVRAETEEALAGGGDVVLIGHSMGAALALAVAAREPRLAGVVALCPPLRMFPGERRAVALLHRVVPYLPRLRNDVRQHCAASPPGSVRSANWLPLCAVHSLFRGLRELERDLAAVRCPALVLCARHDHTVPMRDGLTVHELLSAERKELIVLEQSYHAVTLDLERMMVFGHVLRFCRGLRLSA